MTTLLARNPYGAKLSLPELRAQLADAKEKLNALAQAESEDHASASTTAPEASSAAADKENEDEEEDESAEDGDEGEGMEKAPVAEAEPAQASAAMLELAEARVRLSYYRDAVLFAEQIENVITLACQLLGSKNLTDVTEAINFFVACDQFGVQGASVGVRKMLALAWSKEAAAKDALLTAYDTLYEMTAVAPSEEKKERRVGGWGGGAGGVGCNAECFSSSLLPLSLTLFFFQFPHCFSA